MNLIHDDLGRQNFNAALESMSGPIKEQASRAYKASQKYSSLIVISVVAGGLIGESLQNSGINIAGHQIMDPVDEYVTPYCQAERINYTDMSQFYFDTKNPVSELAQRMVHNTTVCNGDKAGRIYDAVLTSSMNVRDQVSPMKQMEKGWDYLKDKLAEKEINLPELKSVDSGIEVTNSPNSIEPSRHFDSLSFNLEALDKHIEKPNITADINKVRDTPSISV
jgi:hypothetical protein